MKELIIFTIKASALMIAATLIIASGVGLAFVMLGAF